MMCGPPDRYRWVDNDFRFHDCECRLLVDDDRVPSWHAMITRDRGEARWEVVVPMHLVECLRFDDEASARRAVEDALGIDHSRVDG